MGFASCELYIRKNYSCSKTRKANLLPFEIVSLLLNLKTGKCELSFAWRQGPCSLWTFCVPGLLSSEVPGYAASPGSTSYGKHCSLGPGSLACIWRVHQGTVSTGESSGEGLWKPPVIIVPCLLRPNIYAQPTFEACFMWQL